MDFTTDSTIQDDPGKSDRMRLLTAAELDGVSGGASALYTAIYTLGYWAGEAGHYAGNLYGVYTDSLAAHPESTYAGVT
jgi:hypothetical protein